MLAAVSGLKEGRRLGKEEFQDPLVNAGFFFVGFLVFLGFFDASF